MKKALTLTVGYWRRIFNRLINENMTVREFMLKKYPTNEWMDCPVPKHHWEIIQEYAEKYHEAKVKNLSSNTVLADSFSRDDMKNFAEWCRNGLLNTEYNYKKRDELLERWQKNVR